MLRRTRRASGAIWALLLLSTVIAYSNALNGGFVWDDDGHVTKPELQSLHGLWRIWFDLGSTQQYYPLLHSAFWVEHQIWGDAVLGYHLTNVALHATAAGLVILIARRLSLPGAVLAGFTFALHPVCVEAVAWISEQKSTLSAVFYLSSALVYLHFDQTRRWSRYFLALSLFALALLSKTVTATLPAALLVIFWWHRGHLYWKRDVLPLVPWLMLGAAAGLFTTWMEKALIGAQGADFALTLTQRCLLAARVICFDLTHLIWPANLMFIYPRWIVDPAVWWQYLFPAAVLALLAGLNLIRHSRGPLAGFLFFAGTLFPVLGFLDVYPFVYSWVADHFVYLASLGVIMPVTAGLTRMTARFPVGGRSAETVVALLPLVLGVLTWRQSAMYKDASTLYQETLARNPTCWLAHNNLGNELLEIPGRLPEAIAHFRAALRFQPNYPQAYNNLGVALLRIPGGLQEAIADFEAALRVEPEYATAQNNLGLALVNIRGRLPEAITHFEAAVRIRPQDPQAHNNLGSALSTLPGHISEAVAEYEAALRLRPDFFEARFNLANALFRIPGRLPEAIEEYRSAMRVRPGDPRVHNNLGSALSTIPGRLQDAIAEYEAALRLDPGFTDARSNLELALKRMLRESRPAPR